MNNTVVERAEATEEFKEAMVKRMKLPVILWDERLTTIEANRILMDSKVRRENRKEVIDKIAATIILQSYLDAKRNEEQ